MSEPAVTDERGLVYVPRRAGPSRAALASGFTAVAAGAGDGCLSVTQACGRQARAIEAMIRTIRPRNWLELVDTLFGGSWNPSLGRFRSPFALRGHSLASADLSSGLLQLAAGRSDVTKLELHLLRNFRKYAYRQQATSSVWHWLALGQHRGLPTRLLDWTYSPFVALHFSTADLGQMDEDGALWAINFVEANRHLPARLRRIMAAEGSDTATVDMLGAFGTLAKFDRLARRPFVVFLEPPSLDPRILNQFALFSLMSDPRAALHDWLPTHSDLAYRVVIPASLKWEIRDKLDQANINERVLFPGLDGLSRWLTKPVADRGRRAGEARRAGQPGAAGREGPRRRR